MLVVEVWLVFLQNDVFELDIVALVDELLELLLQLVPRPDLIGQLEDIFVGVGQGEVGCIFGLALRNRLDFCRHRELFWILRLGLLAAIVEHLTDARLAL